MPRLKKQKEDQSAKIVDPSTTRIRRKAAQTSLDKIKLKNDSGVFTSPQALAVVTSVPKEKKKTKKATKKVEKKDDADEEEDSDDATVDNRNPSKIEEKKLELSSQTVVNLKELCRVNDLSMEGVKDVLLERVADGMVNGPPLRCPVCLKGRIFYNREKKIYHCKGFHDDDGQHDCAYEAQTVARGTWKSTGVGVDADSDGDDENSSDNHDDEEVDDRHPSEVSAKREQLSSLTVAALKALCKSNDLSSSASKDQLLDRVADAMVNGPPARCPVCFGGRIYYDARRKIYFCKGFYDDDHQHDCTYEARTIKREKWKDG